MYFSIFLIFVILLIFDRLKPKKLVKLHSKLGTDSIYLPLIGHGYLFFGTNEDRMLMLIKGARMAYTRTHGAVSFWIGNNLFIAISDIDYALAVIKSNNDKKFSFNTTKHLMGNGIIFAPRDEWYRRRKVQAPTFAPKHVNKFVETFELQSKVLVDNLKIKIGKGNFSLWEYVFPYGFDALCETTFGINFDMQRQPELPFLKAFPEYFTNLASCTSQPWLKIGPVYAFLPISKKQEKLKKIILGFVDDVIYKKKASMARDGKNLSNDDGPKAKTSLELMIENSANTGKGFTNEELREEVLALAVAGTDTTSGAICYATVLLSQHADVQEKVYNEISEVFGDSNHPMKFRDLQKLKYLEAVIKETLRLYPPIPLFYRSYNSDIELSTGWNMPEGSTALINVWGIHHNPKYWGTDADDFRPERFLCEQLSFPHAYLPFGYGARNCFGFQYALLSMKTALTTILRRYRIKPATSFTYGKNNPLRVSYDVILRHVNNFEVQIEERDDKSL